MTTPEQNLNPFPPKKPVPVGESIIVHLSGKAPKVSTREYKGEQMTEVTFWLGIADKNYPELIGQYHAFTVKPWISPGRPTADPPIQASKLYKTILAIAGPEKAKEFAYHDASLDINAPDFDPGHLDFVGEEKRAKAIPPDEWRQFRGFYVAKFKEPRKSKETGLPMIADDGGIFRQEVAELSPLKAARIFNEEQLRANITWPPPRPELGKPTPARAEDKPAQVRPQAPPTEPTTEPTTDENAPESLADVQAKIKYLLTATQACKDVAKRFVAARGAERITTMKEESQHHLYALLRIAEHMVNGGPVAENANGHLVARKCELHQLEFADAVFLLVALDKADADSVPF